MSHPNIVKKHFTSGEEEKLQNVLSRLEFISSLKEGEKFNPVTWEVRPDGWMTAIIRTCNSVESREECYNFIKTTLDDTIELLYLYRESNEPYYNNISNEIYNAIKKAEPGIRCQMLTYKDSRDIVAKLNTAILITNIKIEKKNVSTVSKNTNTY